jgi:hypothetical protein
MFGNRRYIELLEQNVERLTKECEALKRENKILVERLLLKNSVPLTVAQEDAQLDPQQAAKMLMSAAIFADIDEYTEPEITDNRKEQFDAFAS